MEKMTTKNAAVVRENLYEICMRAFDEYGYAVENIKGGKLINFGEGFAKVSISICDPEKVDKWREEYNEQQEKNLERATKKAQKEFEKKAKATKAENNSVVEEENFM